MFDVEKFKLLLAQGNVPRQRHVPRRSQNQKNRRELEKILLPLMTQAGIDVDELNKLLALQQAARRENFEKEKAEVASHSVAEREAFHRSIEEGYKASEYLKNLPFDSGALGNILTLPTPFLVWEWPHGTQCLQRSHLEPLKSYAKCLLDFAAYSSDNDNGSGGTEVSFYFFWENNSDFISIVKAFSVVGLNGSCDLEANKGFWSGDTMKLSIEASLYPISYWEPLPPGQNITNLRMQGDPAQHNLILDNLTAEGGSILGDFGSADKIFSNNSYGVSYGQYSGISIPGRATALFEVCMSFTYSWDGNTLPDEIKADFADDKKNYNIECPLVALQFLTAPPMGQ
jgi:hypothetical protein